MNLRRVVVSLLLAASPSLASAQTCPVTTDAATYPNPPLTYPMTSDRYAVQYQLGGGGWTDAQVYITYYGGTNSSPFLSYSRYTHDTSISFASIPTSASTAVALRVIKLWGSAFPAINHVWVRPRVKGIHVDSVSGDTVQLSTAAAADFAGEQFILWWDGDTKESGGIQGLAFFLNPPYDRPTGSNVKTIAASAALTGDLSHFDTLDFEGTVAVGGTGAQAFVVPANISNVFLAPGAWVQGKLRFEQSGAGHVRRLYGPGVLDVSRFSYMYRVCSSTSAYADEGYDALSWLPLPAGTPGSPSTPDSFLLDGIIVSDTNHYATDLLVRSTVNNTKTISWNGNNDGLEFGLNTIASNVFVRSGDDSLKMWGSNITVTNATVWQNYNGGVVNLGWFDNSPGDGCLIDGLYVVKTDWFAPATLSWSITTLNWQNNAVVASLMVPGTNFGSLNPSVYRNIYVEDPPRVFLSLKIVPYACPLCALANPAIADSVNLRLPSVLNLELENVFTPASILDNSIGFQTLPAGYTFGSQTFPESYTLTGSMNIGLTNVMVTLPDGTVTALTSENAAVAGKVVTNGHHVNVGYAFVPDVRRHLRKVN
ncbi:MAG: hypothetical protein ACHQQS_06500 [Thermoanaerobaculales bacterium]